ncbi:hypothetical protein EG19_09400 [Thermoanaerobaculum aquaticum]|uniref:DUF1640 domain-containing protein n=1 Tax=Thermoanaerobaculum aquaticum TaxID=1312852 RepID=A0A062XPY9_9BACT|nr:hypothetical protein [Thermoanaerobaculum aquaticum]KDA52863.1 hypothetical protein EG19_09400 [Thermoanaerobaculum aquaticum]
MASAPLAELAERISHLEGWKESQERFAQQLATEMAHIGHRLERLEDAVKGLEQRWDERLNNLEQRWAQQLAALEDRWEKRFSELTSRLDRMEDQWESRFAELRRNFWWLMGFQFTILLAILALVAKNL